MKSNKSTYILIAIAVVVWSLIIFRVIHFTNSEENVITKKPNRNVDSQTDDRAFEYKLILEYEDPFLKQLTSNRITDNRAKVAIEKKTIKRKEIVAALKEDGIKKPEISYMGMMQNKAKRKSIVALVIIDKNNHIMEEGSKIKDILLSKVWKDSIQINWNKEHFIIQKSSGI